MAAISTHVLDLGTGAPASGMGVKLDRLQDGDWTTLHDAVTDDDGRVADMLGGAAFRSGVYRLAFNTAAYGHAFYPEITVVFRVGDAGHHHHVPLLLSAFGYSTYRGS